MARLKPGEEKKLRALASIDSKVAEQLRRHDQLTAQLSDFLHQQNAQNRKRRNRELMIVGACVSAEAETNSRFKVGLTELLDRHATRPTDRKFLVSRNWEILENENTENNGADSSSANATSE